MNTINILTLKLNHWSIFSNIKVNNKKLELIMNLNIGILCGVSKMNTTHTVTTSIATKLNVKFILTNWINLLVWDLDQLNFNSTSLNLSSINYVNSKAIHNFYKIILNLANPENVIAILKTVYNYNCTSVFIECGKYY